MLLADFIRSASRSLETVYPAPEAHSIVLMLCQERLGVASYTHIVEPATEIAPDRLDGLQADLDRLAKSEPIQYVLGSSEFCGRRFHVGPGVLIPRPETELLVEHMRPHLHPGSRVLDLCTGSGCIAWTAALDQPGASVTAVDISPAALEIARRQFTEPAVRFLQADVLDLECLTFEGEYDVLVSNPPYIKESERARMRANVLDHEPALALFVEDTDPLLFYRAVASWAARLLRPDGWGIVEINESLGLETASCFKDEGLREVRILQDFSGRDRFVSFMK